MSEIRNGKIARLPMHIREQLNRRLQDGELGTRLVDWLNGLPEVREILKDQFGGRPVSGQNLSEWKQGGYQDWLRHQQVSAFVKRVRGESDQLKDDSCDLFYEYVDIAERLAVVLSAELGLVADALLKKTDDPQEQWRLLKEVLPELSRLRRHNHRATRLKWDKERWEREVDSADEKARQEEIKKAKDKVLAPFWAKIFHHPLSECLGQGEVGRKVAALMLEVEHDLPRGSLTGNQQSVPVKPGQTESDPIKPDKTGSNPK
jgi:hypothetical protein